MEEAGNSDHLNSSLTDLMTSLMVIFILLLLVFVHRTAGKDAAVTDVLLKKLREDMIPQGFNEKSIRPILRDRNAILVIVPDRLMNFETGKSTLRPEGEQFLKTYIPQFAEVRAATSFDPTSNQLSWRGTRTRTLTPDALRRKARTLT